MRWFWKIPLLGPGVYALWLIDARRKRDWIENYLPESGRILEIGAGPGSVVDVLRKDGRTITGIDVRDSSYRDDLRSILYDGACLPFADDAFDAALLLTVLHHIADPDAALAEAARVAKRVLIIEDIYTSPMQRRLTKVADAVTNLEFFGHPHANRDDGEWRETFERLGLTLIHRSEKRIAGAFLQCLYVVEREVSPS